MANGRQPALGQFLRDPGGLSSFQAGIQQGGAIADAFIQAKQQREKLEFEKDQLNLTAQQKLADMLIKGQRLTPSQQKAFEGPVGQVAQTAGIPVPKGGFFALTKGDEELNNELASARSALASTRPGTQEHRAARARLTKALNATSSVEQRTEAAFGAVERSEEAESKLLEEGKKLTIEGIDAQNQAVEKINTALEKSEAAPKIRSINNAFDLIRGEDRNSQTVQQQLVGMLNDLRGATGRLSDEDVKQLGFADKSTFQGYLENAKGYFGDPVGFNDNQLEKITSTLLTLRQSFSKEIDEAVRQNRGLIKKASLFDPNAEQAIREQIFRPISEPRLKTQRDINLVSDGVKSLEEVNAERRNLGLKPIPQRIIDIQQLMMRKKLKGSRGAAPEPTASQPQQVDQAGEALRQRTIESAKAREAQELKSEEERLQKAGLPSREERIRRQRGR